MDEAGKSFNETLDDLLINDMKVFQAAKGYRFSIDAVLLAHFAELSQVNKIIDIGTGSGVIPLLLSPYTEVPITGIEIQASLVQRALKSVSYNGLEGQISIIHADINQIENMLPRSNWDLVISNPPYWRVGEGKISTNHEEAVARHEISLTMEQLINKAAYLVRPQGKLALVQRADRLQEALNLLTHYRFAASRLRMVHSRRGAQARMMLLEAVKDSKTPLKVVPPLYIYEDDGTYTREIKEMYRGEKRGY